MNRLTKIPVLYSLLIFCTICFTSCPGPKDEFYILNIEVKPAGGSSVTRSPNQNKYTPGTTVTLTAIPASGYQFTRWEGDVTGTSNPTTVTMNSKKNVTAVFSAASNQYTVTITVAPTNGGSVTKSPNQNQYNSGTTVTLTAVPASGYQFTRWEGDATGTSSSTTVMMDGNKNLTAVFTATTNQYTLAIAVSPTNGGSVTKSPNQNQYTSGTTVTLTAVPASGYQFTQWEGDATGTSSSTTVTMNNNKNVTAVFSAVTNPLIQLSKTNLTFTATSGGAVPASQTVNITNGGSGTLSGLSRSFPDGTPLWLSAGLSQTTAPSVLTITVSMSNPLGGTYGPGTYTTRIAIFSTNATNSPQYINVTFTILAATSRSITLINNGPTSVRLKDIVQVKIANSESGVCSRSDLLANDPAECRSLPGSSIAPGQSMKFDITIGPDYYVYIGMGLWEAVFVPPFSCPTSSPFCKITYFYEANTWNTYWVWVIVRVTGSTTGNWNWTISGSYLSGTLAVTPAGNSPILFNRTNYTKIQ